MRAASRTGLEPVGRFRWPHRYTMVRAALAAILLSTAAAVAWHGTGRPTPPDGSRSPTAAVATTPTISAPPPVTLSPPPPMPGSSRLPVPAGLVGVPVPLGSPAATSLVSPGDRVDLLAVPDGGTPILLATACAVLAVDHPEATVLLALTPEQAEDTIALPASVRFAVTVRSSG